ncbi:MAG TPA: CbtA family protein [Magnetospirillaceae bacterium]|jgi:predicted cobalt transporter CbtA
MVGTILARGMLVGIVAGLLAFGFAKFVGEPQVDKAIAFESAMDAAKEKAAMEAAKAKGEEMKMQENVELFSRETQSGIGLFTGVMAYGIAFGGIFSLVFAYSNGRLTKMGPRSLAALIAGLAFVVIVLVPDLKYPANPPSVGNPDTISQRTGLFFGMILCSIAAIIAAVTTARRLVERHGYWTATLAAGAIFIVVVAVVQAILPDINEVPEGFPAVVLWRFRAAALGIQIVMWTTIGLGFGWLTERAQQAARGMKRVAA